MSRCGHFPRDDIFNMSNTSLFNWIAVDAPPIYRSRRVAQTSLLMNNLNVAFLESKMLTYRRANKILEWKPA